MWGRRKTEMDAGRELDALIAEKVMDKDLSRKEWPDGSVTTAKKKRALVPYYSTDIAAAWAVVEALPKKRILLIMNETGGCGTYRARFFEQTVNWDIDEWAQDPDDGLTVWASTAPLAICLAALKWAKAVR